VWTECQILTFNLAAYLVSTRIFKRLIRQQEASYKHYQLKTYKVRYKLNLL